MNTRITQIDIARVARVHNTTVSLALRNSPSIPEATRKRIQAIAQEMGYAPDPALQALVAYRNGRAPNRRQQTLAYITNWHSRWGWQQEPSQARIYAGAQRQAAHSGFQLEHFWLGEPDLTPRRFNSMLFHRNISGLVFASHRPDAEPLEELDWARLAALKIGSFPHLPAIHQITDDPAGAIKQAVKHSMAAGYQRIGLVLPRWWNELADEAWSIAFLGEQSRLSPTYRVPILFCGRDGGENARVDDPAAEFIPGLERWMLQHQPEVVLSFGPRVRTQLEHLNFEVPNEVAFVDLCLENADHRVAGIRENCERVGEVAIQFLVGQLQQNLTGLPTVPTTTVVQGIWFDGESLPQNLSRAGTRQMSPVEFADYVLAGVP